jgi:plastocyanin
MRVLRSGLLALVGLAIVLAVVVPAGAQQATRATTVVTVTAGKPSEFLFALSTTKEPVGTVSFMVTYGGTVPHDFQISGQKTKLLSPGQSQTLTVSFSKAGSFAYICTVPGHAAAGMNGVLKVGSATAAPVKLSATLRAAVEIPHPKGVPAGAAGHFTATLAGTALHWHLTFTHLTGPATMAHIHLAPRGKAGPVLKVLCAPCVSPKSGTVKLTATQVTSIEKGRTYVNVHTKKNPKGEIRGQIAKIAAA